MEAILIDIINKFGYFGIAFLIAVENIFPPIPSEVILTAGGYLTTTTNLSVVGVIISATIGAVLGAIVLYMFGSLFSEERIYAFIDSKFGKMLGFKHDDLTKSVKWFEKWDTTGVFIGRCVPIIRSIISIPAGMVKMPMWKFLTYTTLGTGLWNIILVSAGAYFGENWHSVVKVFDQYHDVMIIVFGLIGVGVLAWWIKRMKDNKAK